MLPRPYLNSGRRGTTLVEVIISASLLVVIIGALTVFSRYQSISWENTRSSASNQAQAQRALQQMAPEIRMARKVVVEQSSSTRLTIRLPLLDSAGSIVTPLQDGQLVSYYLSNATGSVGASGNILWRSVNGTPDATWSLRGSTGRITLATGGLTFSYVSASDPESVQISVSTITSNYAVTKTTHTSADEVTEGGNSSSSDTLVTTMECMLRNKGL